MKIFASLIILIYVTFCTSAASAAAAAATYKTSVDLDYGFYKVIGIGINPANDTAKESTYFVKVNYTGRNLTINVGDTVIWTNYDAKDWPITIMSQKGIWSDTDSYLKYSYRKFNYTFTEPGTYGVYIKENDRFRQTIIVNPTDTSAISATPVIPVVGIVMTPEQTETVVQTYVQTPSQTSLVTPAQNSPEKIGTSAVPRLILIFIIGAIVIVAGFSLVSFGKRKK
jgi:plastocyanin